MDKTARSDERIMNLLGERGSVTLPEVMQALGSSESTARRVMARLADGGRAIRGYGCLRRLQEYSFETLERTHSAEKGRMGAAAAALVQPFEVIYLDSGTTAACVAQALAGRLSRGELTGTRVVTNSMANAQALAACCPVTLTGGEYRLRRRDMVGFAAEKTLGALRFDRCFAGTDAVSPRFGLMTVDPESARLLDLALSRAEHRYALADASKFCGGTHLSYWPELGKLDAVITDCSLEPETARRFDGLVTLILA